MKYKEGDWGYGGTWGVFGSMSPPVSGRAVVTVGVRSDLTVEGETKS